MDAQENERFVERNNKLHSYIVEAIHTVRLQYISDFKGKLFTRQASKADLEACHRLELMEAYALVPLLKSLSVHLSARPEYSTLDKRVMCALANPYTNKADAAKPLLDRLVNCGTIFPAEPAKRSDILEYRSTYKKAINGIVKEIERRTVAVDSETSATALSRSVST
jgi:hypothetical protein